MAMVGVVFLLALAVRPAAAVDTNPISKVVQLLTDLEAKIMKEDAEAKKVHAAFGANCHDTSRNLEFDITTGKSEVEELTATIAKLDAHQDTLNSKIDDLGSSIATDEADLKAARAIRAQESDEFAKLRDDLQQTISAIIRAINILQREMAKHGASMLQLQNAKSLADALTVMVQAEMIGSADASRLNALIQSDSDDGDDGAPAAAVYTSKSGSIVDVLQDLLEKAQEQLADAQHKETTALHNFEMLEQSLEDSVRNGEKDLAATKKGLAAATEEKSTATSDKSVTSNDLAGDESALADLQQECMTSAEDFDAASRSRQEELAALAKAREIIASTTQGATDISYSLAQTSLFQISSSSELINFEAVRFVRELARKNNSPALSQLAARMATAIHSGDDTFGKVKGLIRDLIERLESEASADATEKAYCDKELAETRGKQADKTAEIGKLTTQINRMNARSNKLKQQVRNLQQELASMAAAQAEANKVRSETNALYVDQKAEMEKGLAGVKAALKVLREYYASDDKDHQAATGAGQGIVGLLEVIESDFSKGLAEIVAAEESAASEHKQNTQANQIERTRKEQDVKYRSKEAADLDKATSETSSDRAGVQAELDAVNEYLTGLEKRCIARAETYAERKASRTAEIAGLKEALEILQSQTALIQRKVLRTLRSH